MVNGVVSGVSFIFNSVLHHNVTTGIISIYKAFIAPLKRNIRHLPFKSACYAGVCEWITPSVL